jgi:hypothetical protein
MEVRLQGGEAASTQSILMLETELGCTLSDSFKKFLEANDGAQPETNMFQIGDKNNSGVSRSILSDEIWRKGQLCFYR